MTDAVQDPTLAIGAHYAKMEEEPGEDSENSSTVAEAGSSARLAPSKPSFDVTKNLLERVESPVVSLPATQFSQESEPMIRPIAQSNAQERARTVRVMKKFLGPPDQKGVYFIAATMLVFSLITFVFALALSIRGHFLVATLLYVVAAVLGIVSLAQCVTLLLREYEIDPYRALLRIYHSAPSFPSSRDDEMQSRIATVA